MSKTINPVSISRTRGEHGYSLILERRNRLNQVVGDVSLSPVLDMGYARMEELEKLLEGFIENGSKIVLDSEVMIKDQINFCEGQQARLAAELDKTNCRIATLYAALEAPEVPSLRIADTVAPEPFPGGFCGTHPPGEPKE